MKGLNMVFRKQLPEPEDLIREYPLPDRMIELKKARDAEIRNIIQGRDNRLLLVIGPCSSDREDAAVEYISRLKLVQERVQDRILIVPRLYTNKPRTIGKGYKGMLHQPDPEKEPDLLTGIIAVRKLNLKVIQETEMTCADEMLYPENYRFISDVLSYVAVGARSVEDQQHRMIASGLEIPVGMKNPTSGNLSVMLNSIIAAQAPQDFIYSKWEVKTTGNPLAHAILRGYENRYGKCIPNYHYEDLLILLNLFYERSIEHPCLIVDCNHANSDKQFLEQIRISKDIANSRMLSTDIRRFVKGLMIESYLEDGSQSVHGHEFGKSITDPCLGWIKTEKLIYELADLW